MTPVLAATTQQRLGVVIIGALLLVWAFYIIAAVRRRDVQPGEERELAPNRKAYYDDETLETKKLDRSLTFAAVMLGIVALGLPLYWFREPSRQEGAVRGFDKRSVQRGHSLFQPTDSPEEGAHFGCATCHGNEGQGGVTSYVLPGVTPIKQVTWKAPAVNTVLLRYSREQVRAILVYGRANSPMPAWGVEGGGPLNDQQIDDLVNYMASIQISPDEARAEAAQYGTNGPALFNAYCARCHTEGWSYDEPGQQGGGAYGPSLIGGVTRRQFPDTDNEPNSGVADHVEFINVGAPPYEPYGVRGIGKIEGGGMPGFSSMLTEPQIRAIVDYERGL